MPVKSGDTLRKVTLNLFDADVAYLQHTLGHGYTERIRDIIHSHVQSKRRMSPHQSEPYLEEDFADE